MKQLKLVWLYSTVCLLALMATASWAQDEPPPVEPEEGLVVIGVSQETASSLEGPYAGSAVLNILGESFDVQSFSDPLVLTGEIDYQGRLVATSAHVFQLADGSTLTTVDELRLLPTQPGWYAVYGKMEITGATGIFANGHGTIDVWGQIQIDDTTVTAMSLLEGRILF